MKRKVDPAPAQYATGKHPPINCILHAPGIEHGEFIPFSNIKGSATEKLAQLHEIRDKRLMEPQTSPYRMEDVCTLIPKSVADADSMTVGYHRGCYQKFTKKPGSLKVCR